MNQHPDGAPVMPHPSFPQQVHLSDYIAIIKRRKWIVIGFFLLMVCGVTLFSFRATPVYQAGAQIIIEKQPSVSDPMGQGALGSQAQQEYYQTQYNLLYSRGLALKVIQKLELWKNVQSMVDTEPPGPFAVWMKGVWQIAAGYMAKGAALLRGDREPAGSVTGPMPGTESLETGVESW